ncbi:MAG: alanyl-tRNA editing protein [Alphaproteobacteria bacterium]
MTEEIFRDDAYAKSCEAQVVAVSEAGIELDRTVFYPTSGGQPGDSGVLKTPASATIRITDTRQDRDTGVHLHIPEDSGHGLKPGDSVTAEIDWQRRHRLMRMHTCMHLLCSIIEGDVTGGQVGEIKSRLDFNLPDTQLDKEAIALALNQLIERDAPLTANWITDDELAAKPELVRTMSVRPPSGAGKVRLIEVEGIDLQPCGGTHVARTGEIGRVRIGKIENKGRQNRRVNILFDE